MMKKVKQIPFMPARLNNCQGDINKRWYIVFYAWNNDENRLIRKHDYDVNKIIKDSEEATRLAREEFAKQRIEKINKLLASDYSISAKKEKEVPPSCTLDEIMRYVLFMIVVLHLLIN